MHARISLLALALGAAFLVSAPAQAAVGTVSGTITGPGGTPLPSVEVHAWSDIDDNPGELEDRGQTVTDAEGHYSLPVDVSPVQLCFAKTGYVAECYDGVYQPFGLDPLFVNGNDVVVTGAGVTVDADLVVGSTFSGQVTADSGSVAPGSSVRVSSGSPFWLSGAAIQPDGSFSISHVPPGTYTVCASGPNLIKRCTGDVGGPASYTVDGDDAVVAGIALVSDRPTGVEVVRSARTGLRWAWAGVAGATSYRVALSTSPSMSPATVRQVAGTQAGFSGLVPGKRYYFAVRGTGPGFGTNVNTLPTPVDTARAGIVLRLAVVGGSASSLDFTWLEYGAAAKYEIQLSSTMNFAGFRTRKVTTEAATFSNLASGTTYYARVRAISSAGNVISGWSSVAYSATGP